MNESAYAFDARRLQSGNQVDLLINGDEAFPVMLEAINEATQYVHLETYILREGTVGNLFKAALIERAQKGVTVRVIYDAFGSLAIAESFVGELKRAGVQMLMYRPLRFRNWGRWSRRDHRKILVVDGEVGFTGGLNIADDYAPKDVGGAGWRDTHCQIRGPVVNQLERMFATIWRKQGGLAYKPHHLSIKPGNYLATAIASGSRGRRTAIRRWYLHAIRRAKQRILIANAYFVPDPGVVRALVRASRRGVDVRIVTAENSDVKLAQFAGESMFSRLLRGGVRIHLWPDTNMHAKTAAIDGVWAAIGSYNLDYVSLFQNLEVIVAVLGKTFGKVMEDMFEDDLRQCREVHLQEWRARSLGRKLLSWFCYQFRRWL